MNIPNFGTLLKIASTILSEEERLKAISLITDMQQTLSALQTENFQLKEQVFNLKNQIRDYEDWKNTKDQYQLTQKTHGASLYIHKNNQSKACPTCMGNERESIMQPGSPGFWSCHNCKLSVEWEPRHIPDYIPPENPYNRKTSFPR